MPPFNIISDNGTFMLPESLAWPLFGLIVFVCIVELVLKGIGLWRAARLQKTGWFVALLLINTAGILPLIFILTTKEDYEKLTKGKASRKV